MPTQPEGHSLAQEFFEQGRQSRKAGDKTKAASCFREAIKLKPDYIPAYNNLANLLQEQGEIAQAIYLYEKALAIAPHMAVLHCNHASLLQLQEKSDLALAGYQKAIALKPDFIIAHHNLAKVLVARKQLHQAEHAYLTALNLQPTAELHLELGHLYRQLSRFDEALENYKAAIRIQPSAQSYNCLGAQLKDMGGQELALSSYRRALKLEPDYEPAHYNLALLLDETGDLETAQQHYQRSLELKPDAINIKFSLDRVRLKLADWQDYDARLGNLITATKRHLQEKPDEGLAAFGLLCFPLPIQLQTAVAQQLAATYVNAAEPLIQEMPLCSPSKTDQRLRIGYVSPDFRGHAVGTLIHQMFQYHDRERFEVFAYSLIPADDEWAQSIRQGCGHFAVVANQGPLAIAKTIRADGIDILFDLAGYTAYSQTTLFALKPAPVQIQYLGYPGTMGADFMPYILADETLIPSHLAHHYSEKVIYLPHAWVASPMTMADSVLTRQDYGLPDQGTVFCCFNGTYKINPEVFQAWMQILQHVPGSVLWLADGGKPIVSARLRDAARHHGVDPARLVFVGNVPHADYLARYRLADLFLDTLVYNAGATAVGAFWAGLPVLTCPGETYVSRMGASLCNALDMPELICSSLADYAQKAINLGNAPIELTQLKQKLARAVQDSPLFKPDLFVKSLEQELLKVWQAHHQLSDKEQGHRM